MKLFRTIALIVFMCQSCSASQSPQFDRAYTFWQKSGWENASILGITTAWGSAIGYVFRGRLHSPLNKKLASILFASTGIFSASLILISWTKLVREYQNATQHSPLTTNTKAQPSFFTSSNEVRHQLLKKFFYNHAIDQRELSYGNIHTLVRYALADIEITQGNRNHVLIQAPRNVLYDDLQETYKDGTLTLTSRKMAYCWPIAMLLALFNGSLLRVHYTVTVTNLNRLKIKLQ